MRDLGDAFLLLGLLSGVVLTSGPNREKISRGSSFFSDSRPLSLSSLDIVLLTGKRGQEGRITNRGQTTHHLPVLTVSDIRLDYAIIHLPDTN